MRKHPRELPTTDEIRAMIAIEARRKPLTSRSFSDYRAVRDWLGALKIGSDLFEGATSIEEVNEAAGVIKPVVVKRTLEIWPYPQLREVEEYLGEEDELTKADVAIVFGGKTLSRAGKGAEMYNKGLARMLLMTGKGPNYKGVFNLPEAEVFKKRAMELGVPEEAIITEAGSINIPSNVRASLNLLDELCIKYTSLMQIISWYAQRRAWCELKRYVGSGIRLIRVNADLPKEKGRPHKYEKGEWYRTAEGIEIVFNEFVKMKIQDAVGIG